jgi:Domain of unknown function (DUF4276)
MGKRVIVIASGETERMALPYLLRPMVAEGITILEPIRTPPRNRALTRDEVTKLIISAWYSTFPQPDKFVVLVDADGKDPAIVAEELANGLHATKCQEIPAHIKVVAAKWHLEAWFWADPNGLREYLGRDLGGIDTSNADGIQSPKNCLKQLLDTPYTARVAGEIAERISAFEVRKRSLSFSLFEHAVRNGSNAR